MHLAASNKLTMLNWRVDFSLRTSFKKPPVSRIRWVVMLLSCGSVILSCWFSFSYSRDSCCFSSHSVLVSDEEKEEGQKEKEKLPWPHFLSIPGRIPSSRTFLNILLSKILPLSVSSEKARWECGCFFFSVLVVWKTREWAKLTLC